MILKILLVDMIITGVFMYLLILGANKSKTVYEIEQEDKEQMEFLTKKRRKVDGF